MEPDVEVLLAEARGGRRASLAKLLTMVERGGDVARRVSSVCHPRGGSAVTVGITGAPGSGKSTLTNALCSQWRLRGVSIGVLAVDPSSPFSGGAILGDRVRMGDQALAEDVYIRSMATRGHLGGLAVATPDAVDVLDAAGYERVVIETVGVGQVEIEVAGTADTTVVVINPGWGDSVQANKAGLMEIADVFVINKADRPGVSETRKDLERMLALSAPSGGGSSGWSPAIVEAVATDGRGSAELADAIDAHRAASEATGSAVVRRRERARRQLRDLAVAVAQQRWGLQLEGDAFEEAAEEVAQRRCDPWTAAERLLG